MRVAALYVEAGGCYFGLPDVDPWDEKRDARLYAGPWPVVAHPPCERWGRYWGGGPNPHARRRILGDDGGCFASALASVRTWGGVLEHPEGSHAWGRFGIGRPVRSAGWSVADGLGGWTCYVEQGSYGHPARKSTWLYAFGVWDLPWLQWRSTADHVRLDRGFHSKAERAAAGPLPTSGMRRLSKVENRATPPAFRDVLIDIARRVESRSEAA